MVNLNTYSAIVSKTAHPKVSENYGFMNTKEIVGYVKKLGYEVVKAQQTGSRNPENSAFKKHLVRMRKVGTEPVLGEVFPEIVILNSHEATTSLQFMFGLYRLSCANGLIVADQEDTIVKLRHSHVNQNKVKESVEKLVTHTDTVITKMEEMKKTKMSKAKQLAFANDAMAIRFDETPSPLEADQLLDARRSEDTDNNLWAVFNRVQENLIIGGLKGKTESGRQITTRPITRIHKNVTINQRLWELAETYKKAA